MGRWGLATGLVVEGSWLSVAVSPEEGPREKAGPGQWLPGQPDGMRTAKILSGKQI